MRSRSILLPLAILAALSLCLLAAGIIYTIPAVNDRVYPRIDSFMATVRDIVSPHSETIPTPSGLVAAPPTFAIATSTGVPATQPSTADSPLPTAAPTTLPLVYDLPSSVSLDGARYEPQLYNNCGPATLTAGLVYWGWRGSEPDDLQYTFAKNVRWQRDVAAAIKPQQSDKNVMVYELANFATDYAGLGAAIRYGGDVDTIRLFVANGFPVIIERGFRPEESGQDGWEGHYGLITGYDDGAQKFLTQDSYKGENYWRGYDPEVYDWRDFNYVYLILYAPAREAEVLVLLGADADPVANFNRALAKAQAETQQLTDSTELAFAWHNVGTSLTLLERYTDAAAAFDQARTYGALPWRMFWYQTGTYKAYYYSGRYQDVIDLANVTLQTPGLEESYYWRGWSYYQIGDLNRAAADMRAALDAHPNWDQALAALAQWGVSP